ncbi:MAG TPA: nuclear transport factor 2 family protein [Candidatus Binataceae bacterium]|jgi:ketosteroid isomerase-like protein|nr:nuclear transport factor 2 family protein [Candidatus Binataceae bacterium]
MSAAENKEIIRKMGEAKSLDAMLGVMADDIRWTLIGNTKFSGTFNGKKELLDRLIYPLFGLMESMGTGTTDNVVAEGDYVVIQTRGSGRRTKSGNDYNNTYCIVYRLADGKVKEVTEYCDTELITAAFGR